MSIPLAVFEEGVHLGLSQPKFLVNESNFTKIGVVMLIKNILGSNWMIKLLSLKR